MPRLFTLALHSAASLAFALDCDMSAYRDTAGLKATMRAGAVELAWDGADRDQARAEFAVVNGAPLIRELAVRRQGGQWITLGRDLTPEFHVTTGKRRISEQQLAPLRKLGLDKDAALLDREKWKVLWDAPLVIPGATGTNPGLPRSESEVRRDASAYKVNACRIKTDGARLELSYDGLTLGIFSGGVRFTVYRGANLLRQEAIARTEQDSVAYHYRAGLRGLRMQTAPRVHWRDVARAWQKYEFGGSPNQEPVALRARNRLALVEAGPGSIAVFPPPHKFFFGREIELNLGYVFYRKDDDQTYSVGVRQADREEMYRPFGFSDDVWQRRSRQSRSFAMGNFALFNAPAGTLQRMPVYYHLSPDPPRTAHTAVMAFTHGDEYKPLPGFQVAVSHFHTAFHEQVLDAGGIDMQPPWIPTFRALGINIAMMSDFHGDGHAKDPGPLRFKDQKAYFDASRRHSDKDFLIIPGEEPNAYFGGHYTTVFPRPVYWAHVRGEGKPFSETVPEYGKVYRIGNVEDELRMLKEENGLVWQAHPRTKGSSGYPDAIRETAHFRSDRFLGGAFQSLPVDLSEQRLCEVRCLGTLDDMNNWAGPKFLVSEGDTYAKFPDDDTYPHLMVNYVKLARLPSFDESWNPIVNALRAGDFFVSSGEVLFRSFAVEGSGNQRTVVADVEWTFPLELVELVWGDGERTDRRIIAATDHSAFGRHVFRIPFDAAGKKWVRLAVWDSAGNGAFWQPVHLR